VSVAVREEIGLVPQLAREIGSLWLFDGLPAIELIELARVSIRQECTRLDILEHQAHGTGLVYGLYRGDARVVRSPRRGVDVTVAEMHAGDVWGMSFLAKDVPRVRSRIEVISSHAVVYAFPDDMIRRVFDRHPQLSYRLIEYLFACLEAARDRIEQLATLPVEQQLAQILAEKALRHPNCLVTDTQPELARMIGASRETVNRAIKRLMATGLVVKGQSGRGLVVPDPGALLRLN
jgi:CRP-like cAMP-binding protein